MKKERTPHPPKWATWLLTAYCRPDLLEDLQGDLNEFFQRNLQTRGAFMARLIYIIDVLKFFRPYTVRKPQFNHQRSWLLGSYVRTSGRSILRSKLFSGINIVGLAVGMSVGLLVIAMVSDLTSYDSTLKNRDRMYRIASDLTWIDGPTMKLASTSWKAGMLIRQDIPGVESLTILRNGFGGDAKIGGNTIPMTGLYADAGFFDVFSFPLDKGVAASALKEPHSLVLTETTAKKLFGTTDPMGKVVTFDSTNYKVTGVLQDIPKFSHLHFEMLVSLSSIDLSRSTTDGNYMEWGNCYSNYVYLLLAKNTTPATLTAGLTKISNRQNLGATRSKVFVFPQPVKDIPLGKEMGNEIGAVVSLSMIYILAGLALVIILSACFNYTNLSIARSLRRSREVGIRKIIGAVRGQVMAQFIAESVIISLLSLVFAVLLFLLLRGQFLAFHEQLQLAFSLNLTPRVIIAFVGLAIVIGVVAGLLPAVFYSKINAVQVLKDASSLKIFRHLSLRKALVVIQYTFSLIFITATVIGYNQYRGFLKFDLGFNTSDILNIKLQGNNDEVLIKEISAIPAVKGISQSLMVNSLGSMYGVSMKYRNPADSSGVYLNKIDNNYLPLHHYTLLAGRNFTVKPKDAPETEIIVNEQLLKRFDIAHRDPQKALGEQLQVDDGKRLTIIGVVKDFHYGTLDSKIDPTAFRYSAHPGVNLNVKLSGANLPATMATVAAIWKSVDKVHPLDAKLYEDQIEEAYSYMAVMLKVIGFFAMMAICISSLGLFGMVLYTMQKRVKEVSIRKVLGAKSGMLVYLLSKGFLFLLLVAAAIALPLTWLLFEKVVLAKYAYHQPIGFGEIFIGLAVVAGLAFVMIGLQTMRVVRANPANVLKNE